jgi:hypothetical protein
LCVSLSLCFSLSLSFFSLQQLLCPNVSFFLFFSLFALHCQICFSLCKINNFFYSFQTPQIQHPVSGKDCCGTRQPFRYQIEMTFYHYFTVEALNVITDSVNI